ncbi:TPA: 3-methyl-2-oxobutanoate hydroxymethyltransferase [candidate division WOR-3 bacterium]|jgi:3-methyl-2-oxobutanoate hydroxymethyltransferase|uniref:3-methyl-2-oxobutanoate hydroxymethyltransferase n=1 Tax=candidate division WOR-3 bacterium TaxID=2052148 RepID=A0A350H8M2_UNCW3|nr:3-methyl-2-oxobutanoate hydroxymethyltransferase [candidate division WOR-3 bacterium]
MKIKYKDLLEKKKNNRKAVLVTAYDYSMAKVLEKCRVDAVLVGDSASMVMLGNNSTLEISLDEMIVFSKGVRKGLKTPYLIVDMPFMSYQPSRRDAIKNCGRVMKETRCDAVKMEGGRELIDRIKAVIDSGIPVCGHIGMKPQSFKKYGGYPIMGYNEEEALSIIRDGIALEKAGAEMIIIESTVDLVTKYLKENLSIPVYSIGSGRESDGQIVVVNDIIGFYSDFVPRFINVYENISGRIENAVNRFSADVEKGRFPQDKKIPKMSKEEFKKIIKNL